MAPQCNPGISLSHSIGTGGMLSLMPSQIAQLTQAGAGLIGVILHLRSSSTQGNEAIWHLAMQGLPAAIQILRQLGKRVSEAKSSRVVSSRVGSSRVDDIPLPSRSRAAYKSRVSCRPLTNPHRSDQPVSAPLSSSQNSLAPVVSPSSLGPRHSPACQATTAPPVSRPAPSKCPCCDRCPEESLCRLLHNPSRGRSTSKAPSLRSG